MCKVFGFSSVFCFFFLFFWICKQYKVVSHWRILFVISFSFYFLFLTLEWGALLYWIKNKRNFNCIKHQWKYFVLHSPMETYCRKDIPEVEIHFHVSSVKIVTKCFILLAIWSMLSEEKPYSQFLSIIEVDFYLYKVIQFFTSVHCILLFFSFILLSTNEFDKETLLRIYTI